MRHGPAYGLAIWAAMCWFALPGDALGGEAAGGESAAVKKLLASVPADASGAACVREWPSLLKAIKSTSLWKIWEESEIKAMVKAPKEIADKALAEKMKEFGFAEATVESVIPGPYFVAAGPASGEKIEPAAVLLVGLASDDPKGEKIFKLMDTVGGELAKAKTLAIGPAQARMLGDDENVGPFLGAHGGFLFFGAGKAWIAKVLEGLDGKCANPLKDGVAFKASGLTGQEEMWLLGSEKGAMGIMFNALMQAVAPEAANIGMWAEEDGKKPDLVAKAREQVTTLGMDKSKCSSTSVSIRDGVFEMREFTHLPAPRKGLMDLLDTEPVSEESLKFCPAKAPLVLAVRLKWEKLLPAIKDLAKSFGMGEGPFDAGVMAFEEEIGFKVQEDLLANFSKDLVLTSFAAEAAGDPTALGTAFVACVGIKDAARAEKVVGVLLALAAKELPNRGDANAAQTVEYEGAKIQFVQPAGAPVCIGAVVTGGRLFIGLNVQHLKRAVRAAAKGEGGLLQDAKFQDALKLCGGKMGGFVSYYDTASLFTQIYTLASPFIQMAGEQIPKETGIDLALLPTAECIAKHLTPVLCVGTANADGILLLTRSKTPPVATLAVPLAAIGAAVAVPNLFRSRMAANEAAAVAGCRAYASAQNTFRRTDYDNDTTLEYAQVIHGGRQVAEPAPEKLPAPAAITEDQKKKVAEQIPKLSSDDFETREKAMKDIEAVGSGAIPQLKEALAKSKDPEIQARATQLVRKLTPGGPGSVRKPNYGLYQLGDNNKTTIALVDLAFANAEEGPGAKPKAGYFFRVLTSQRDDEGKAIEYINPTGQMTIGYGLLAYPAEFDKTGRSCFMVNTQGTVYQKDFGSAEEMKKAVKEMGRAFDVSKGDWFVTE